MMLTPPDAIPVWRERDQQVKEKNLNQSEPLFHSLVHQAQFRMRKGLD